MTSVELIRLIGLSHLLQPPLTQFLASPRGLDLRASVVAVGALASAVLSNLAIASVALPTVLGVVLACYPSLALVPGPARAVALLLSVFWCWRLYRQLFVLHPLWPRGNRRARWMSYVLLFIFFMQGPVLALLVLSHA